MIEHPPLHLGDAPSVSEPIDGELPANAEPWQRAAHDLLAQAARLCAGHGVELDAFARAASIAYFNARPGLRERMEEMQLRAHIAQLRQRGRLGRA